MSGWDRDRAIDRVEELVDAVATEELPVPVREVWVFGDLALGLDPVDRLDVYVTKDLLFGRDEEAESRFRESHSVEGVGKTVRAEWAKANPESLRANPSGHVAPEQCLAAHLLEEGEPIHLEVCNASFEDNVTRRLEGAKARGSYEEILDPRGVCLWLDGRRSEDAFTKLHDGEFVFPTLPDALGMLGLDEDEAQRAAGAVERYREEREGLSVRGDVV
ncbi:hypothetical protein BRD19_07960 [Halobacteriales archaeon SW_7_65_23]|nr:MAG: hypothetical protein BRD19_07960 [Halobacteriales archaeon SW_7_65_23]